MPIRDRFDNLRMVLPRLTRDLPRPFKMEGMERKDDTPQHKAMREALTNAIIHADLMLNGILKVEKYDDKFVLTNPGLRSNFLLLKFTLAVSRKLVINECRLYFE